MTENKRGESVILILQSLRRIPISHSLAVSLIKELKHQRATSSEMLPPRSSSTHILSSSNIYYPASMFQSLLHYDISNYELNHLGQIHEKYMFPRTSNSRLSPFLILLNSPLLRYHWIITQTPRGISWTNAFARVKLHMFPILIKLSFTYIPIYPLQCH